jgi:hypothetical protein
MLFNIDRRSKDAIRDMYKEEADLFYLRKQEEKAKRLQEEKEYMQGLQMKAEEESKKKYLQKVKLISETMNEYKEIIKKKEQSNNNFRNKEIADPGSGYNVLENISNESKRGYSPTISNDYQSSERNYKLEQQRLYKNYLDNQINHKKNKGVLGGQSYDYNRKSRQLMENPCKIH